MVEVDAECERDEGVTYVRATVTNTRSTPQTVRLRSALDGPTWTPKFGGVPTPEWTDGTWTAVVRPGGRRGLGFASSAPPADPPVEVVSAERASPEDEPAERSASGSTEVIATLEDWSPPSDLLSRDG